MARFKVTGGDRLLRLLKNAPKEATAEVRGIVKRDGLALAEAARAAAPTPPGKSGEATGALKAAIKARFSQKGLVARVGIFGMKDTRLAGAAAGLMQKHGMKKSRAVRIASQLGAAPHYARWVEFGTTKMAAQPYLYPAFRQRRREIRQHIAQAATRAIKKAAR